MKKIMFSLILIFISMMSFSSQVFASTISNDSGKEIYASSVDLTEQEQLISEYIDSFGDWNKWYTYYASEVQDNYRTFVTNPKSQQNSTGVLVVNQAKLLYIKQIDNNLAPRYPELKTFYYDEDNYRCYLVGIDMDVKHDSPYYYDGINYKLIIIVKENGNWKIGAQCGAPIEQLINVDSAVSTNKAIEQYCARAGIDQELKTNRAVGYGFINGNVNNPPQNIYVGDGYAYQDSNGNWLPGCTGTVYTVDFQDYVYNATSNEIYSTYDEDAIIACAISIKMYAWWCHLGTYRETFGCDILGNYDQAYDVNDTTYPASISSAINNVISYYILSSDGKFFSTNCNNFTSFDYLHSGQLIQSGAQNLANNYNYTWQQIIHYYFDNSSYNHPDCGIVLIGTHSW